ncbi:MAG: hypothetical protein M2R45_03222 [Verrucomicrobia subdivision 3 bacterium]|nr:hypothetical protein [Limisphaerales bacterium]MCS1413937.1 hypothetical protein [Limisphaerales bacterium]
MESREYQVPHSVTVRCPVFKAECESLRHLVRNLKRKNNLSIQLTGGGKNLFLHKNEKRRAHVSSPMDAPQVDLLTSKFNLWVGRGLPLDW